MMPDQEYTMAEVLQHNTKGDWWLVFQDCVYDVSNFDHPGGIEALMRNAGKDATIAMFAVEAHTEHISEVLELLKNMKIGKVKSK